MKTKPVIEKLNPYQVKDIEVSVKLDANESNNYLFSEGLNLNDIEVNLYPDTTAKPLRQALSKYFGINQDNLMVGSGSSELIELIIKTYVAPGEIVLSFEPSFTMYNVYSTMHGATFKGIPVEFDLSYDLDKLIDEANRLNPKLIIICTPNNPTGYQPSKADIKRVIENTNALILLDEAYMDFTDEAGSFLKEAAQYDKLIVSRTFSKAFGLAGARLGYLSTSTPIMKSLLKVKTPYSVSSLSQAIGVKALKEKDVVQSFIEGVKSRRDQLSSQLKQYGLKVYPSNTNFLFVETDILDLDKRLIEHDILIRDFSSYKPGFYRISVGSESDNRILIKALKEVLT